MCFITFYLVGELSRETNSETSERVSENMKTKVKYEKFEGEEVGWFNKSSPKIVSHARSPKPAVVSKRQSYQPRLRKSMSESNINKEPDNFTYQQFLSDKNAKIIALLENKK